VYVRRDRGIAGVDGRKAGEIGANYETLRSISQSVEKMCTGGSQQK